MGRRQGGGEEQILKGVVLFGNHPCVKGRDVGEKAEIKNRERHDLNL